VLCDGAGGQRQGALVRLAGVLTFDGNGAAVRHLLADRELQAELELALDGRHGLRFLLRCLHRLVLEDDGSDDAVGPAALLAILRDEATDHLMGAVEHLSHAELALLAAIAPLTSKVDGALTTFNFAMLLDEVRAVVKGHVMPLNIDADVMLGAFECLVEMQLLRPAAARPGPLNRFTKVMLEPPPDDLINVLRTMEACPEWIKQWTRAHSY
jgi:hypothetical protein